MSGASSMRVAVADAMRRSWTRPLATRRPARRARRRFSRIRKNSRSETRPGALRVARAGDGAGGKLRARRTARRQQNCSSVSSIDVGFAVEAEDGVLVPVLRGADKKSLKNSIVRYNELVELARERKLPADATGGSIATVTNFGTFGLMWATPIPLPEQTLVLGMGAATARAALGRGERPVRAGDGGEPDVELRPSRAGRRRGGTIAFAHRGFDVEAGEVVKIIPQ